MDIINKLILLLSGQGFILAFLIYRKEQSLSHKLISSYILLFSGILVYWYFSFWNNTRIPFIFVFRLDFLFQLYLGPLLFLLVRPRLSTKRLLTVPIVLSVLFLISWVAFVIMFMNRPPGSGPLFSYNVYVIYNYSGLILISFYLFKSYAYLQSRLHRLLFYCLLVYLLGWVANLLISNSFQFYQYIDYSIVFAEIALFYGTGYYTLVQIQKTPAYHIEPGELKTQLERISTLMSKEEPFADNGFTLQSMAESLEIHPKKLSQIINKGFGQSFTEYVNTHRIDKAKELLLSESYRESTVLEILLECGFNSKSAFNHAFKKYTGQSPLQFKKSVNPSK